MNDNTPNLSIVTTKMMVPRLRDGFVSRPFLVARLNNAVLRGLVIISAPAGFGKTTLLVEWAAQSPYPVAWLSLDERDNNPQDFLHCLFLTVKSVLPDFGLSEIQLSKESDPSEVLKAGLIRWINEFESCHAEIALVLDEFHFINDKLILSGLSFFLEHMPARLHLFIAGRSDPHLSLARLRARNQLDEIRAADLKFRYEESAAFLRHTMHLNLSDAETHELDNRTEGWVAGLQLAAISLQHQSPVADLSGLISGDNTYILDFLVEEVFDQQDEKVQNFLLRTSILENLNGSLCAAVALSGADENEGRTLLHDLYHSNLFITALDIEEHWFRYHPLFVESLRHLLTEKLPAEIFVLHQRACIWYQQHGFIEDAIRHALVINDFVRIAEIIEKNAETVMKNGGLLTILNWIKKLPRELIKTSPVLCIVYAWGLSFSFETGQAVYWVNEALTGLNQLTQTHSLSAEKNSPATLILINKYQGQIQAVQSILAALAGDTQKSLELSREALDKLPADDLFQRSYILLDRGFNCLLDNDIKNAEAVLKETIQTSQIAGNWLVMMVAHYYLGRAETLHGKLSKALTLFKQIIPMSLNAAEKPTEITGTVYIGIADILFEYHQINEALDYYTRGLGLCKNWLPLSLELDVHIRLAHLNQVINNREDSLLEFQRAHQVAVLTENEMDDRLVSVYEIKYALLNGDWHLALDWAQKNGFWNETFHLTPEMPFILVVMIKLNLVRIWLALSAQEKQSQYAFRALSMLQDLLPRLEEREAVGSQIESLLLMALAYQQLDDFELALDTLEQAYRMGEPEGYRQIFLDEGIPLARLTSKLLARVKKTGSKTGIPTREFLLELISQFSAGPEKSKSAVKETTLEGIRPEALLPGDDRLFELLTARELDVLKHVANGASNAEIAVELCLALNTVKRHLNHIFAKLGVKTRTQAVILARRLGIIN
ncbi:MAG: LuxR C-terminal-related transcriptional regulator [Anaerolineae bacterium]|nr:LuxR C-terminal-related transcriptional regulator [Anaerolineae bacterium]